MPIEDMPLADRVARLEAIAQATELALREVQSELNALRDRVADVEGQV
jgi:hypothetical protein